MKNLSNLRVARVLVAGMLAAVLSGCMWSRHRMNDPEIVERAASIRPGVTTVQDLPRLLGAQPTRRRAEGKLVTYEYSFADSKSETFSIVILTFSRTENVTETLYVETDAETGKVVRVPQLISREPEWRCWPFGEETERK